MLLSDPLKVFFCFTVQAHTVYTCRSPSIIMCNCTKSCLYVFLIPLFQKEREIYIFSSLIPLMVSLHMYFKLLLL